MSEIHGNLEGAFQFIHQLLYLSGFVNTNLQFSLKSWFIIIILCMLLIESLVLTKFQSISWQKSLLIIMVGNIYYLIIGMIINYGLLVFGLSLISSLVLIKMYIFFNKDNQKLFSISQKSLFVILNIIPIFAVSMFTYYQGEETLFYYLLKCAVIFMGLICRFIIKGFAYSLFFPPQSRNRELSATFMTMQVATLPLVLIAFYLSKHLS